MGAALPDGPKNPVHGRLCVSMSDRMHPVTAWEPIITTRSTSLRIVPIGRAKYLVVVGEGDMG